MSQIIKAESDREYNAASQLFKEYAAWLNIDLCFQKFDEELLQLKEVYAAPLGIVLLVKDAEEYIGCVAVRQKGEGIAELKRMYIKPDQRKAGVGSELLNTALDFAANVGYKFIRLDTLANMTPAINLYKKAGFYEIDAYYHNPEENALFFEKKLG